MLFAIRNLVQCTTITLNQRYSSFLKCAWNKIIIQTMTQIWFAYYLLWVSCVSKGRLHSVSLPHICSYSKAEVFWVGLSFRDRWKSSSVTKAPLRFYDTLLISWASVIDGFFITFLSPKFYFVFVVKLRRSI